MKLLALSTICAITLFSLSSCSDAPLTPEEAATNMTFVTVPPGSVEVPLEGGSSDTRTVGIDYTLEVSAYETTQEEFKALLAVNPSWFTGANYSAWYIRPVEHVTWFDAVVYCNRLSEVRGLQPAYKIIYLEGNLDVGYYDGYVEVIPNANGYRLPTVNEWEYACRAGTTTDFYTGNLIGDGKTCETHELNAEKAGWYCTNSRRTSVPNGETKRVGQLEPNSFGIYDMHGNVWEWCQEANTVKGGSWANEPFFARSSASVGEVWQTGCEGGARYFNVGFRVVRTVQ